MQNMSKLHEQEHDDINNIVYNSTMMSAQQNTE